MIFSVRRKAGRPPNTKVILPRVLISSSDTGFADKIGETLDQWGFAHHLLGAEQEVDVALLDVRERADETYGLVYSARQQYAGIEVILINRPANVAASIAGMKAGAVDEIIVPLDTEALKGMISEACERVRAVRDKKANKTLLTRFSEAMMAATFAQAGDFDGALDMLDNSPESPRDGNVQPKKNKSGS